jgi:hypothetical protein
VGTFGGEKAKSQTPNPKEEIPRKTPGWEKGGRREREGRAKEGKGRAK